MMSTADFGRNHVYALFALYALLRVSFEYYADNQRGCTGSGKPKSFSPMAISA